MARRFLGIGVACGALATGLGFGAPAPLPRRVPAACAHPRPLRIVLVAIDGVRWQDVFEGTDPRLLEERRMSKQEAATAQELTPNLHAMIERGVALGAPGHGAGFFASGPNFVSLPGYSELLNGRPATCLENDCGTPATFSILDGFAQHYDPSRIGSISSWTNIERVAASPRCFATVSAGRMGGETRDNLTHDAILDGLLDRGAAAPAAADGDYRSDESTAALALGFLDEQEPPFLFVSLGDTDEFAHQDDYRKYLGALRRADAFIGDVVAMSEEWRAEGVDTMIVVTADHGRADDFKDHGRAWPESARSWLVAAGGPVPALGYVDSQSPHYLRDVAPTLASLAGVEIEIGNDTGKVLTELAPACAQGS